MEVEVEVSRPFDTEFLLAYLRAREVEGVEEVGRSVYRRSIRSGPGAGVLTVDFAAANEGGRVRAHAGGLDLTEGLLTRMVEGLIDARAPTTDVSGMFSGDAVLGPLVRARPGIRIPGTVDPFELAVRAILGQQVSISAARTFACRTAACWGIELPQGEGLIGRVFPSPELLLDAPLETVGLSRGRAEAVRCLARAVVEGCLDLRPGGAGEATEGSLLEIKGVGPWTASYVGLRGLGNRDGIPTSDLGLRQALQLQRVSEVERRVADWRPLRGYAAALLWSTFLPI